MKAKCPTIQNMSHADALALFNITLLVVMSLVNEFKLTYSKDCEEHHVFSYQCSSHRTTSFWFHNSNDLTIFVFKLEVSLGRHNLMLTS